MGDLQKIMQSAKDSGGNGSSAGQSQTQDQALAKINRDMQEKAARVRAKDLNLPYIDIGGFPINPDVLKNLSSEESKSAIAVPYYKSGSNIKLAVYDPARPELKQVLDRFEKAGFTVQINIASQAGIYEAAELYASPQLQKPKEETKNVVIKADLTAFEEELQHFKELVEKIKTLPAEDALNEINVAAIRAGSSDLHFQPEEKDASLRFRIDGVLYVVATFEKELYDRMINQLKYKAKLKLNVTSEPQDGRYYFIVNDKKIDVRVASIPTEYGESVVCRILDTDKSFGNFEALGFSYRTLELLKKSSALPQGMVLTTGPTSSGKSTTLYVLLTQYNSPQRKVITLEDPIEYHMRGVTQSQINEKRGYSFAAGLRSILRHDPNVVMIGEIRDRETAEVATQAALAGHVMLSTLHANSAIDAIPRLITMGVPPYMIAPAVSLIIAQRLVRRLCSCSLEKPIQQNEREFLEKMLTVLVTIPNAPKLSIPPQLKGTVGCDKCSQTGYRGVQVIAEGVWFDNPMREIILRSGSGGELFDLARKGGMMTMAEDGVIKVLEGKTTLQEVYRVTNT